MGRNDHTHIHQNFMKMKSSGKIIRIARKLLCCGVAGGAGGERKKAKMLNSHFSPIIQKNKYFIIQGRPPLI